MAVATTLKLDGQITGLASGRKDVSLTVTTSKGVLDAVTLSSGVNTITYASGTQALLIIPPSTNTITVTLKGASGDTGIVLHPTNPNLLSVATTSTQCLLSAGGTVTAVEVLAV